MTTYIIAVTAAAVTAAAADILAPKEWGGYIHLVVGFLVLSVLLAPAARLNKIDLFAYSEPNAEISDAPLKESVVRELEKRVEEDIKARLEEEFATEAEVWAEIETDGDGRIKGVRQIVIKSLKKPDGIAERLKEVYGCERIEFE